MEETNNGSTARYHLRWNNHPCHVLSVFESLLNSESLVDVSLVGDGCTIKAHKVVLSACSPYFARIFSEHLCRHPVVILKDFPKWQLQALVDFMYRGEVSVEEDQLPSLMKAADALKIQGLTECRNENEAEEKGFSKDVGDTPAVDLSSPSPPLPLMKEEEKTSPLGNLDFPQNAPSPSPRRKQARPQRRHEEHSLNLTSGDSGDDSHDESLSSFFLSQWCGKNEEGGPGEVEESSGTGNGWATTDPLTRFPVSISPIPVQSPSPVSTSCPPTPTAITSEPSRSQSYSASGGTGPPMFSAPRGGPPRHWSNENLTEALRHVWSGRMKTAQASRVFGIPYNSLLMYVRGKYGKTLKLDLARKGEIPPHLASHPFHLRTPNMNHLFPSGPPFRGLLTRPPLFPQLPQLLGIKTASSSNGLECPLDLKMEEGRSMDFEDYH